jgi:hypothetical protein
MTTLQYFSCAGAGVLGIMFHIFVVKLPALKKRSAAANIQFSIKGYFQDDWIALGSSVIALFTVLFVIDEVVKYKPIVADFIKWLFVFVGYTGSSTLQALLSRTDTTINKVVDVKTNIADGVIK